MIKSELLLRCQAGYTWQVARNLQGGLCWPKKGAKETQKGAVDSTKAEGLKKGVLAGVWDLGGGKFEMTTLTAKFDKKSDGKISKYLEELYRKMKLGRAFILPNALPDTVLSLASIGPKNTGYAPLEDLDRQRSEFLQGEVKDGVMISYDTQMRNPALVTDSYINQENVRWGMAAAFDQIRNYPLKGIYVDDCNAPDAAAEAVKLTEYNFKKYKDALETSVFLMNDEQVPRTKDAQTSELRLMHIGFARGDAQNWARYLTELPPNLMQPVVLAKKVQDKLQPLGIKVEAQNRDWIVNKGMEAFLTVANGSCAEPVFLECVYNGAGEGKAPILLSASGVTFESGGLNLRTPETMMNQHGSMAGAAVVLGTLYGLAKLKVKLNVAAVIPLCENMISGQSVKVGDVVKVGGKQVQIARTDFDGELLQADALVYGQAEYKPSLVLNVFTGRDESSIGSGAFGCYTPDDVTWLALKNAGALSGDRPWRMPVWDYYGNQLKYSLVADLTTAGADLSTSNLSAAFLRNFMTFNWVHLDVTGVTKPVRARVMPPYLDSRYTTGRPTRTIIQFLNSLIQLGQSK